MFESGDDSGETVRTGYNIKIYNFDYMSSMRLEYHSVHILNVYNILVFGLAHNLSFEIPSLIICLVCFLYAPMYAPMWAENS